MIFIQREELNEEGHTHVAVVKLAEEVESYFSIRVRWKESPEGLFS